MDKEAIVSIIEDFLDQLYSRNYSKKTIESYAYALNSFTRWLEERKIDRLQDVAEDDLIAYRKQLLGCGCKSSTIEAYMKTVKLLFKYMEAEGIIFINPAEGLLNARGERRIQHVPSLKEMEKLLDAPNTANEIGIRNRAIIETLYSSGVRLEECVNLSLGDLDLDNGLMKVMGKGSKERIVPLGKHAIEWIKRYLSIRRADIEALWSSRDGDKICKETIQKMIPLYAKEAGIKTLSAHAIRRACATHMLRNGAGPMAIKELLGHADLKTLGQYLQCTITDLKKMHANSELGK